MGNPIQGCRRECESDFECDANRACMNFRCQDPCGTCGTYADCNVRVRIEHTDSHSLSRINHQIPFAYDYANDYFVQNHRAICSCPANFLGDPFTRCYPECTQHEECRATQACFNLKCVDPCTGACGIGAECRVESHKAICSCPKGYTGHPFDRCRPFDKSTNKNVIGISQRIFC